MREKQGMNTWHQHVKLVNAERVEKLGRAGKTAMAAMTVARL